MRPAGPAKQRRDDPDRKLGTDKGVALRWVLEAADTDLPSVKEEAWLAAHCLSDRVIKAGSVLIADEAGPAVEEKLRLMRAAHQGL